MKKGELAFAFLVLAEWTGLEPATPGVTGRYSNQLNYHSLVLQKIVSVNAVLPENPAACSYSQLVGAEGLEPPTFAV